MRFIQTILDLLQTHYKILFFFVHSCASSWFSPLLLTYMRKKKKNKSPCNHKQMKRNKNLSLSKITKVQLKHHRICQTHITMAMKRSTPCGRALRSLYSKIIKIVPFPIAFGSKLKIDIAQRCLQKRNTGLNATILWVKFVFLPRINIPPITLWSFFGHLV